MVIKCSFAVNPIALLLILMNVNGSISDAELLLSRTHQFLNGMFRIPVGRNDCVCTQSEAL